MKLYTYWRSSASYRVRIGLNLKGMSHELIPLNLIHDGGEQHKPEFIAINPQGQVPALELDDGTVLTQSLPILEYLEETQPEPALLPAELLARTRIRALAQIVCSDIHPLNNTRVLNYLVNSLGTEEEKKLQWYRHWIIYGFTALETLLAESSATGAFCHGEQPTLADICLVPQVYNARRFGVDMQPLPIISRIEDACLQLPAFSQAAPENQPDAV